MTLQAYAGSETGGDMSDTLVEVPCTEPGCTRVIPTTAGDDLRKIKCPTHSERMRTCKCHSCAEQHLPHKHL